ADALRSRSICIGLCSGTERATIPYLWLVGRAKSVDFAASTERTWRNSSTPHPTLSLKGRGLGSRTAAAAAAKSPSPLEGEGRDEGSLDAARLRGSKWQPLKFRAQPHRTPTTATSPA